ncbi:MAG TPA: toll/interleukin-1 receptor domain-containing protein [Bryobacteraceae bacterium]|nr:toll/interleukin-1 receptor domain-containing protein [Bryobacteraceae bacterium]
MSAEELADLISAELKRTPTIEIEGLGLFRREATGRITFIRGNRPRVFVAYALEDIELAERLFADLSSRGYAPWLDRRKLLPGQNWPRRIQDAIESSDFFIACFSTKSVNKRGGFQAEIRYALDCANRVPLDDVYLIPVRLDDCRVPTRIRRETQYIDLFPDWNSGLEQITGVIERRRSA